MRLTAPTLFVLGMMTLAAMPQAAATHGDTAYLISRDPANPFYSESKYITGPGYLNQYWDFAILGSAGVDKCPLAHGGWDPDPRLPGVPAGFRGTCNAAGAFRVTGTNEFINYPNPQGFDGLPPKERIVKVSYNGATFDANLIVCDSAHPRLRSTLGSTYCNDIQTLMNLA